MILVRIDMHALSEKQKEVVQTLMSMAAPMGSEAGCLSYELLCDMTDKNLLCVLEEWENREKLDHHLNSNLFGILLGTRSLLHQSHGIRMYTAEESEKLTVS